MNRPVLVTGSSSGIGLSTTRHLAERGVPVYATVRNEADAARLDRIDGVEAILCDVTDDDQVARMRQMIEGRGRGLWGLVNNAGVAHAGALTDVSVGSMREHFEINLFGVHRVIHAVADLIIASAGRIVNISSIHGTYSGADGGVYSMAKHALEAYTDSLALELRGHGVHVCVVAPGNFDSALITNYVKNVPMQDSTPEWVRNFYEPGAQTARPQFPPPDAVARACYEALFDPAPLRRYLITPNENEAHVTLKKAALELVQLNQYTPYRHTTSGLYALIDEVTEMLAAAGVPPKEA